MKKTLKIVSLLVAAGILILLAAGLIVPRVIDPATLRDKVGALLQERSGREVAITGAVELSFFPWVGASLGEVTIGNAKGFDTGPMARFKAMDLKVKLLPLVAGRVEVDRILVKGLDLSLGRNQDGTTNWDDLVARATPPVTPKAGTPAETPAAGKPPAVTGEPSRDGFAALTALSLGGISLEDGRLHWQDRRSGTAMTLDKINLKTGPVTLGAPVEVTFAADFSREAPRLSGHLEGEWQLVWEAATKSLRLDETTLSLAAASDSWPLRKVELGYTGRIAADLERMLLSLTESRITLKGEGGQDRPLAAVELTLATAAAGYDLTAERLTFKEAKLSGQLQGGKGQPYGEATLAISGSGALDLQPARAALDLPGAVIDLAAKGGSLPPAGVVLGVRGDIAANLGEGSVRIAKLDLTGPEGLKLQGNLHATRLTSDPALAGQLQVATFDPRALMAAFGHPLPVTADPKALTAVGGKMALELGLDRVKLTDLDWKVDDSRVTGAVGVKGLLRPSVNLELVVDNLDLDRYASPPAKEKAAGTAQEDKMPPPVGASGTAAAGATVAPEAAVAVIPAEILRVLTIEGKVKVGRLAVGSGHYQEVLAVLTAREGLLRLDPFQAKLYGGTAHTVATLDVRGEEPKIQVDKQFKGVQAEPLLTEMAGVTGFSGTADVVTHLTTRGATVAAMKRHLNGSGSFGVFKGEVAGVNIVNQVRQLFAAVQGIPPRLEAGEGTRFSELTGTIKIVDGVIRNEDLLAVSPLLKVTGAGSLDLGRDWVDYELKADLLTALQGLEIEKVERFRGVMLPLHLKGPMASLGKPKIDDKMAGQLLQEAVKARVVQKLTEEGKVKEKVQKLEERLGGKVPVGDLIKGLGF
ncbi:MAG: AsmA family protein [Magnetococcales bacterium]|nr:AsmA family protein [Magnetococcales bacterium]